MIHDSQSRWNKAWSAAVPVEPNASADNGLAEVVTKLRNLIKDLDGDVRTLKAQVETLKAENVRLKAQKEVLMELARGA
jgi:cell division protein FtsB